VRVFWAEAVVAEVYALNSFLIVLLVFLYIKASKGRLGDARYILLSGFVSGLAVVNHESAVLYLPALVLTWLFVPVESGRERLRASVTGFAFFLLGLSVFLYLPVRSTAAPWVNIGHPDTFGNFLWTVKWGEYLRAVPGLPARMLALGKQAVQAGPALMIAVTRAAVGLVRRASIASAWSNWSTKIAMTSVSTVVHPPPAGNESQFFGSTRPS
jgi:4-amino-4-deoxy-L-arabinose transferase-like glycosyltransferase